MYGKPSSLMKVEIKNQKLYGKKKVAGNIQLKGRVVNT